MNEMIEYCQTFIKTPLQHYPMKFIDKNYQCTVLLKSTFNLQGIF